MFEILPGFMAKHGADQACVDAWKVAGAELASVQFTALKDHWNAKIKPNKQATGHALFLKSDVYINFSIKFNAFDC